MKRWTVLLSVLLSLQAWATTDVNTATEAELDAIKGLGPASTALILHARAAGPFKNWDDFMARVKGIKPAKASKLSENGLTVANAPFGQVDKKP